MKRCLYLLLIASLFTSCISREKLNYFQDAAVADTVSEDLRQVQEKKIEQIRIRPYDILDVQVRTPDERTNKLFGAGENSNVRGRVNIQQSYQIGYSVGQDGTIQMPLIGEVNVLNLTVKQAREAIEEQLSEYVRDPYVQVKFLNYKIFVLGEVKNSGLVTINNESATVMEAISLAGGITQYGKRNNVRVFRGTPDNPIVHELDLTSVKSMSNPGYFIEPYDIIYVEPLRRRTILANISTINTFASIITTVFNILVISNLIN